MPVAAPLFESLGSLVVPAASNLGETAGHDRIKQILGGGIKWKAQGLGRRINTVREVEDRARFAFRSS
jgi:hypothetical protein